MELNEKEKIIRTETLETWRAAREIQNRLASQIYWELGKLYNYPECCIKQFINEAVAGIQPAQVRTIKFNMPLDGSGFVPCDKCFPKFYGIPSQISTGKIGLGKSLQ